MKLTENYVGEFKRVIQWTGPRENSGMGYNAEKPAQDMLGDRECFVTNQDGFEPRPARPVFLSIVSIRRNKDVYIRQYHRPCSSDRAAQRSP